MLDIRNLKEYDKDIKFLEEGLKTNRNTKPVGLHSIEVANILLNLGYRRELVQAGLFHDLIEDTDVTADDISKAYGKKISNLVDSMSYDIPSKNYELKYKKFKESMDKILDIGSDALIIDAADFISNCPYYKLADTLKLKRYLKSKYEYFMDKAKPFIGDSKLWVLVEKSYEENVKNLF